MAAANPPRPVAPVVAVAPTDCAPVPAATAGTVMADLDGDGAKDQLVPTACDRDGTCTWALFTVKAGCAQPLGTIAEVDRVEALPMTVNGRAVVRTLSVSEYYRKEAVPAWSGSAWFTVFDATCAPRPDTWWCEAAHTATLPSGEPAPEVPCVTVATATAPTLDLDRDGAADALVPVACGDLRAMCGTLVLRTRAGCTRPLGFLPPGAVSIPDDLTPTAPPRIRVQRPDPAGADEQIELGVATADAGFEVLGTRTCDRGRCGPWTPPDRGGHD